MSLHGSLLLAADQMNGDPNWMVQLGIAVPFVLALGFLGRWHLIRLERVETEKSALYDKIIEDVVPALRASSELAEKILQQQQDLAMTRSAYVERLENVNQTQRELLRRSEELRLAEFDHHSRRDQK